MVGFAVELDEMGVEWVVTGCPYSRIMQMRYRYRIEPTPAQRKMLARVFGCCRVVFNDALRVRDEA